MMTNSPYKYKVVYSSQFKSALKKVTKQGKDLEKLRVVVQKLSIKEKLEPKYLNHPLKSSKKYKNCFECHIEPDWLLIYEYVDDDLVLLLVNTGSHSDLL